MKKFLIKVIAVVITGSLAGGSLFYLWKNKYASSKDQIIVGEELNKKTEKNNTEKIESDKKISDTKAEIIDYIEKNINKISLEKPARGLMWRPVKIWFIDEQNFYVDYKDEVSNTRRILLFQSVAGPAAEYKVLGFFIPGENGWILKSGKDIIGITSLYLYEKNEETGEWAAK